MKEQGNSPEEQEERVETIYQTLQSNDYKGTQEHEKDKGTIKKDQSEIKNAVSEINNTLDRINSRLDEVED